MDTNTIMMSLQVVSSWKFHECWFVFRTMVGNKISLNHLQLFQFYNLNFFVLYIKSKKMLTTIKANCLHIPLPK